MPGSSDASIYPLPVVEVYSIEESLGEGGIGVLYPFPQLRQACLKLETAGMAIHAMCARRNIGAAMGDDTGCVLVAEMDATLRNQGVKNPRRFAETMAPGFDIGDQNVE